MNPFNRTIKRIQQNRAAISPLSKKVQYLRNGVAERLVDRLLDIKRDFNTVLDLGCGSGHLIKYLDSDMVKDKLVQYDMAEKLVNRDINEEYSVKTERIIGDLELLPFKENSFDAVLSSLALHWVNDLPGCLIQVTKSLKPDGVFLGAMFGGETLYELRTSLQLAEIERDGGVSPHISPMVQSQDMGGLLSRAGLTLTTVDVDEFTVNYPSMFELMQDLNAMGEGNALHQRRHFTSKDVFLAASAAYSSIYGNEDGTIPATFQIIYMIGWKPCDSQPKPLPRGSAKMSFKDLDAIGQNDPGQKS